MQSEHFGRLVSSIYQASTSEIRWDKVLDELADIIGGRVASMAFHDFALKQAWLFASRTYPEVNERYTEHYWKHNVLLQLTRSVPPGVVMTPRETMDPERLEQSRFYREWWQSQEIGLGVMTANLSNSSDAHSMVSIGKARADGFFDSGEKALFAEILPHLIRGLDIYRRLQITAAKPDFSEQGAMPLGLAVVDRAGRILDTGQKTLNLLNSCGYLRFRNAQEVISTTDGKLEAMIRSCTQPVLGKPCGGVLVGEAADGSQVKISVTPCPEECLDHPILAGHRPAAILLVSNAASEPSHVTGLLQEHYGLTPAQAAVAVETAKGRGRKLVAEHLGLQLATVRTHLSAIFAKTGVSRQAELARLIAELK